MAALADAFQEAAPSDTGLLALTVAEGVAAAVGEGGPRGGTASPALGSALLAAWAEAGRLPPAATPPAARAVAASTFRALVERTTPPGCAATRLAPRLAAGFGLGAGDLGGGGGGGGREAAATAALLAFAASSPAGAGPAAALLASLPGLPRGSSVFDAAAVAALLAGGGEAAAAAFASARGAATPAPAALVDACLSAGRLRSAAAYVRRFGLRGAYPAVEADAQADALAGAVRAGAWDAAISLAGRPAAGGPAPAAALRAVAAAAQAMGRPCLAADVLELAGLREGGGGGGGGGAAASRAWAGAAVPPLDAGFLPWPPGTALSLVADAAGLEQARGVLLSSGAGGWRGGVGLDLEWEEVAAEGGGAGAGAPRRRPPVSTLQLACPAAAFVFDLAGCEAGGVLGGVAALAAALLASTAHPILGVGLRADLARLASALPASIPPGGARRCIDAGKLLVSGGGGAGAGKAPLGLAALAAAALGAPLDKALRTSAWAARPLSAGQARYAGLDALVPALVWEKVQGGEGVEVEEWEWGRK